MVAYIIMTIACWVVVWVLLKRIQDLEKEVEMVQDDIWKLFTELHRNK